MRTNGELNCDFCYAPRIEWQAKMDSYPVASLGWRFEICDSCRILLRNVVGPALHRLTQSEIVAATVQAMSAKGLEYADLMKPLVEIKALENGSKDNVSQ